MCMVWFFGVVFFLLFLPPHNHTLSHAYVCQARSFLFTTVSRCLLISGGWVLGASSCTEEIFGAIRFARGLACPVEKDGSGSLGHLVPRSVAALHSLLHSFLHGRDAEHNSQYTSKSGDARCYVS